MMLRNGLRLEVRPRELERCFIPVARYAQALSQPSKRAVRGGGRVSTARPGVFYTVLGMVVFINHICVP